MNIHRVIVAVMKVMALSIMEVMEVICMVADGRERILVMKVWTHDNSFDWGLSFQAGLEIGSCVMNVGYDASLGKEYEYDSVDLKYHTFSLSVGYKFKLGK